jgi:hypothetical protein
MRSRRFTKLIELWETENVPDGFGGYTVSESKRADIWANLQTMNKGRYSNKDFGDIDFANSVMVTTRDNPNIVIDYKTNFIKYRGENYFLSDRPVITDFEDNYVTFIMVRNNDV